VGVCIGARSVGGFCAAGRLRRLPLGYASRHLTCAPQLET
jgi:hypothetical protein